MANPITATDYKAETTQCKQRIYGGKFFNPMGGTPSVVLDEQFISYDAVSDKIYVSEAGSCQAALEQRLATLQNNEQVDRIRVFSPSKTLTRTTTWSES